MQPNCNTVARLRVAQHLPDIVQLLKSEPNYHFSPYEISRKLGMKQTTVRSILHRYAGKSDCPIYKVERGLYKYDAEKSGELTTLLSRFGKVGIENLIYTKIATKGAPTPKLQSPVAKASDSVVASSKPGYPKQLPTGQELRWEIHRNGTEIVSFVSKGTPFSLDLLLYLHEELSRDGLTGDGWKRASIEVNKDGLKVAITPECVTLQETSRLLLKCYNHGKQLRAEVADRREISLKDSLSFLLGWSDQSCGHASLRKISKLEKSVTEIGKTARIALNVATKEREKRLEVSSGRCKKLQESCRKVASEPVTQPDLGKSAPGFVRASELRKQQVLVAGKYESSKIQKIGGN